MAILDVFYFLFRLDPTDLKKGMNESVNSAKTSAKTIDNELEKIGTNFARNLVGSFTALAASIASIHGVISGLSNAVNYDIQLGKTSRALGVDAGQLDIWSRAVQQAGGSSEDFQASLRGVAATFHTTAQVALKAFPQLANVLSHLSRYGAFTYGKAIGLNEPTILLLQKGQRELDAILKRQRELGVLTKESTEISTKYNQELLNLDTSFRFLYNAIAISALPAFTEFSKIMQSVLGYLTEHKSLVIGAFVGIGAAAFSAALAFIPFTGQFLLLSAVVIGLIALFALFWDDYTTYMNKGNSLTGDFIEEWKKLDVLIKSTLSSWIDKLTEFLDKFSLTKGISKDIKAGKVAAQNSDDLFHFILNYELAKKQLDVSSSTPLNNATASSRFYDSAFNKNFVINSMPIEINTQATDAVGIATHLSLTINDQLQQASNFFANSNYV